MKTINKLTLQIHLPEQGWTNAADLVFETDQNIHLEYELDFATQFLGASDHRALSVKLPVGLDFYRGPVHGFILDLIPQGPQLRKLLAKHFIRLENSYRDILTKAPLAPPGNIRILEPWEQLLEEQLRYDHDGFTKAEVVLAHENFVEYMIQHGAPVGGTSGAGGGAPKFLLREDLSGRFHAEGMLPDQKTKRAVLVKFPFTDSKNSLDLQRTEKAYYDLLQNLPVRTGSPIEIEQDVLFITRFDRLKESDTKLNYLGL